jgi:hypothetical protein
MFIAPKEGEEFSPGFQPCMCLASVHGPKGQESLAQALAGFSLARG